MGGHNGSIRHQPSAFRSGGTEVDPGVITPSVIAAFLSSY
jgi:hypothetical protein